MASITGGEGNDTLTGTGSNDTINARGGNDTVFGLAGNDTLNAGSGIDEVYGGDGADQISGALGTFHAGAGNDSVTTTGSTASLYGELGDDLLVGSGGSFFGGIGNDVIRTSVGAASILAGDGNDDISISNTQIVSVDAGFGDDLVRISGDGTVLSSISLIGGTGHDRLFIGGNPPNNYFTQDKLNSIFAGISGFDEINFAGLNATTFQPLPKIDLGLINLDGLNSLTVTGGIAVDGRAVTDVALILRLELNIDDTTGDVYCEAYGSQKDDYISGQVTEDFRDVPNKKTWFYGEGGNDEIIGTLANNNLFGGQGHDTLTGDQIVDSLYGGGGNDRIAGEDGGDFLSGGKVND